MERAVSYTERYVASADGKSAAPDRYHNNSAHSLSFALRSLSARLAGDCASFGAGAKKIKLALPMPSLAH